MPNDEYRELIEFLGRKFDEVDARFGQVDARLAEMATKDEVRAQQEETRRHFDVMVESFRLPKYGSKWSRIRRSSSSSDFRLFTL